MPFKLPNRHFTSLIYPRSCLGCDAEIGLGSTRNSGRQGPDSGGGDLFQIWRCDHWCSDCQQQLGNRPEASCAKCGAWLTVNPLGDRCRLCFRFKLRFDRAFAMGNYQTLLRELVTRMKNGHDEPLAYQLGEHLGFELKERGWTGFDWVVPVPSYWWRRLQRGFLAAYVISESVSRLTGIARSANLVKSIRQTGKQGRLSTQGRFANVRNAFEVNSKKDLSGARILLVDDVMTSGATVSELARVLKRSGAEEVCAAVIARGTRVG